MHLSEEVIGAGERGRPGQQHSALGRLHGRNGRLGVF